MKNERQKKILEVISTYDIDTQEALIAKLAEQGLTVTQTTVSRDIRDLGIVKIPGAGGSYHYGIPGAEVRQSAPTPNSLGEQVISVRAAQNLIVIRTVAGMANAVCVYVESFRLQDIIGTVAGDDTILLVLPDTPTAKTAEATLRRLFNRNN